MSQAIKFQKIILLSACILFIIKFLAWFASGSVAILSDALESLVNIASAAFTLFSLNLSIKPGDFNHPYGHGKIEFIAAVFEGFLVIVGGLFILGQAGYNIFYKVQVEKINFGAILILTTAIINFTLSFYTLKTGKQQKSPALLATAKHLQIDAISSLLIIIVLIVVKYSSITLLDPIVAVLLAIYMVFNGYKILRRSLGGIMDEADSDLINQLSTNLQKKRHKNWVDLHNVRFIKFGGKLHLDCHLTLPWYFNLKEAHREIDRFSEVVDNIFNTKVENFTHSDYCHSYACSCCIKKDCKLREHKFKSKIDWSPQNIISKRQHSLE